jgi:hypothetical protein
MDKRGNVQDYNFVHMRGHNLTEFVASYAGN